MSQDDAAAFWGWFDEVRGDLSIRQVEERAKARRGRIGNAYSAGRAPTALICRSIAEGLGIPEEMVFRHARLLEGSRAEVGLRDRVVHILERLDEQDQNLLLTFAERLLESGYRGAQRRAGESEIHS